MVDKDIITGYLNKWKDILRLRDWDIKLHIVEKEWRKSGDIKIDEDDKKAILLVNSNPKSTNLEELVVHELLHLKLWGMDQMIEGFVNMIFGEAENDMKKEFAMNQFFKVLESTVEDLTKGYLVANGNNEELSFGRMKNLVIDETGEEINFK